MGILNINDLKAGMVLAQSAMNKHGAVILGEGCVLTQRKINSFKAWGVTEVDIQDIDSDQVVQEAREALSKDIVESIERKLDALFPPLEGNPVMEEICKVVRKISLRQAANQTNGAPDEISKGR